MYLNFIDMILWVIGEKDINDAELLFLENIRMRFHYEKLKERILDEIPGVQMKVQKAKSRPDPWLVVTFGLEHKVESSRIDVAMKPCPNRWMHHVMISSVEEVDDELMKWIKKAGDFALRK